MHACLFLDLLQYFVLVVPVTQVLPGDTFRGKDVSTEIPVEAASNPTTGLFGKSVLNISCGLIVIGTFHAENW